MQYQSNPYLIWHLIPGIILLGIGLYIQSRPTKKRVSNVFSVLMFGGSLWAFSNAIQLITPNPGWQRAWNSISYLGVMLIPTSWFLLSIKLTGFARERVEKIEKWFWVIPVLLYLSLLTTTFHRLFFVSYKIVTVGGYASLKNNYGFLFYVHTGYSYILMVSGIIILGISLAMNFKRYGAQAYGLIIGVLAPLLGNAYFLFGSVPPGFPDPTPIIFTVTGVAFSWAIFGGHILEVVPFAHESIVRKLSTGVMILDAEKNVRDINDAAREMLGLTSSTYAGDSLAALVEKNRGVAQVVDEALDASVQGDKELQVTFPDTYRTFDVQISHIGDDIDNITGWLIQFSDISEQKQVEARLENTRKTYEEVMDTLQDVYFEADPTGVITYANHAFVKAVGYSSKEELIGKHFRHVSSRNSIRSVYENFKVVYETDQAVEPFEFRYRYTDGTELVSEMVVSPVIENGETIGTRGLVRDISVRVKAEEMLREAKEAAEYRTRELAALNRVAETVSRSLDLNDILQSVCQELTEIFAIRNAGVGLLTPSRDGLEIVAFHAVDPDETSALGMVLPFSGNLSSQEVIEHKKTVVVQDAQSDPRTSLVADISKERGTKSIMIVPLLARGEAIGTIGMPAKDPNYIYTDDEIELAETIASQIATAVDNAQMHAQTESALDVAERDLEIGRQIQSGFFPETLPDVPGWEIATHFHAARQVAGDFYDIFKFRDSNFTAFIIADVCDKGVGAALFMVLFRSLLRAFSEAKITAANVQKQLNNIILSTNNFIAEYHGKSNMFATLFFGILDPENDVLFYVNGGHEPPAILDKDGRIIKRLMPTGPAVGLFANMEFKVEQIRFDPGNLLVGFTDGTTDARSNTGEQYSEERLLKSIAVPWTSIFSMLFEMKTDLQRHIGEQQQFDDITLIALRRKLTQERNQHAICRFARMEVLGELRDFVEDATLYCGISHDDAFAFKLAADEICTNIIQYGYEGRDPGLLTLFFDVESKTARLTIRDDGKYFPPEQAKTPDIEAELGEREVGGLGLYLVKELMDNVNYSRVEENVNQFILEKELK